MRPARKGDGMLTLLALGGMTCLVWGMTVGLAILDEKQAKLIGIPLKRGKKGVRGAGR
ncbi:MAG: hypothetical protein ACRENW_04885 [Thermodesulfobacteriota bacterium]